MSVWMKFVVAALATWRVTHLLASEDGPADIVVRVRRRLGDGVLGRGDGLFLVPQHLDRDAGRAVRDHAADRSSADLAGTLGRRMLVGEGAVGRAELTGEIACAPRRLTLMIGRRGGQ